YAYSNPADTTSPLRRPNHNEQGSVQWSQATTVESTRDRRSEHSVAAVPACPARLTRGSWWPRSHAFHSCRLAAFFIVGAERGIHSGAAPRLTARSFSNVGAVRLACCNARVGFWHFSDLVRCPTRVRKVGQSRH